MPQLVRTTEQQQHPLATRAMPLGTVDDANRTVEVTWTTGALVQRYDWARDRPYMEQLSQEPGAVRMQRLQSATSPVLNSHNSYDISSVLGVVQSAEAPSDGGSAVLRFSKRPEVEPIYQDVKDKILTNVSLGARIYQIEMIAPGVEGNAIWIYRATDWEPYEISMVPINADAGAVTRSADDPSQPKLYPCECTIVTRDLATNDIPSNRPAAAEQQTSKGSEMPGTTTQAAPNAVAPQVTQTTQANAVQVQTSAQALDVTQNADHANAIQAERTRVTLITTSVRASTLEDQNGLIDGYVQRGVTVEAVNADILSRMAQRSAASNVQGQRIETVRDETDVRREAMTNALQNRIAPGSVQLTDAGRAYRGMTLREMTREGLEAVGISTRGMSALDMGSVALGLTQRGVATSDLPLIFGAVITRTLRRAYEAAPRTFTSWATPGTLSDFRAVTRASFDAATKFERVGENGEYKYGQLKADGEVIQLGTYGKVVAFTRQMIINDDLSALQRMPQFFGRAAADMESDLVYGVLTANAKMSDGVALFDDKHGNLINPGGAIGIDSLSAGRASMRVKKAPGGSTLNLTPRTLLVPAALETQAYQYTSNAYTPTAAGETNPFQGLLTPVVEARLDADNPKSWYLIADREQIDTVEFAHLDGEQGLFTEQWTDPDVEGLKVKGRIDFAAKAIDHRGMHKNKGG